MAVGPGVADTVGKIKGGVVEVDSGRRGVEVMELVVETVVEEDVDVVDDEGESVDTTPPMPFRTTPIDLLQQAGSLSQQ